jgi:two-component system, cell cycle sensor histidine kinase and response regulator CckA
MTHDAIGCTPMSSSHPAALERGPGSPYIHLPLFRLANHPIMTATPEPDSRTAPRAESGATILVVEDEDALRAGIRRLLQAEGYHVLEAQNGATALHLLDGSAGESVALVLTDLRMPVMDGRQLASALARRRPSLPIVFMSGFTAQLMDLRLISPHLAFLAKPFRNDDLLAAVRSKLGA